MDVGMAVVPTGHQYRVHVRGLGGMHIVTQSITLMVWQGLLTGKEYLLSIKLCYIVCILSVFCHDTMSISRLNIAG